MRTAAFVLFFALVVIACGQAPKPQAPVDPRTAQIELDAALHERLQLGLPMAVELRAAGKQVGTCTLYFDLWEELYKASRSHTQLGFAREVDTVVRHCIETQVTAAIHVRELPHTAAPRTDYPVF